MNAEISKKMSVISSSVDIDYECFDIEDQLENFFVRKRFEEDRDFLAKSKWKHNRPICTRTKKRIKVLEYIPLLLTHIVCLDKESYVNCGNGKICYAYKEHVYFKSCIVHARVVNHLSTKGACNNYMIDDGTAAMELHIPKKHKYLFGVWRLQTEVEAVRAHAISQRDREICEILRQLLLNIKHQADTSSIAIGQKLLIIGLPTYFAGRFHLTAFNVVSDGSKARDLEVAFKNELLHWHKEKYPRFVPELTIKK